LNRCVGIEIRPEAVDECIELANKCGLADACTFLVGDMRNTAEVLKQAEADGRLQPPVAGYGGLFSSIPFYNLEEYDSGLAPPDGPGPRHPRLLEHCPSFEAGAGSFIEALRGSLESAVSALAADAWIIVHCAAIRDKGRNCDIPFQVKTLLTQVGDTQLHHNRVAAPLTQTSIRPPQMTGVTLLDEVVVTAAHGSAPMRAAGLYTGSCSLVRTNTRIVVAWKGDLRKRPRGDVQCPMMGF
jgi:hypothetical protein